MVCQLVLDIHLDLITLECFDQRSREACSICSSPSKYGTKCIINTVVYRSRGYDLRAVKAVGSNVLVNNGQIANWPNDIQSIGGA